MKILLEIKIFDTFSIGLFNTWIFVIPIWLLGIFIGRYSKKGFKRATDMSWYTLKDKISSFVSLFSMISFMVVSLFIPLNFHPILFFIGLLLIIIGSLGHIISKIHYMNEQTDKAVISGLYRYSRNPMYFFFLLILVGSTLIAQSLIMIIICIISIISTHFLILGEERYCKKKYGDSYIEYMKKVPRYFLLCCF